MLIGEVCHPDSSQFDAKRKGWLVGGFPGIYGVTFAFPTIGAPGCLDARTELITKGSNLLHRARQPANTGLQNNQNAGKKKRTMHSPSTPHAIRRSRADN